MERQMRLSFFDDASGVTYEDISGILAARQSDDRDITLHIKSMGGLCSEGYAIYDALRACEGCTIKAVVEGECASMATILLLAASDRGAYANTRFLIHQPRLQDFYIDDMSADDAQQLAGYLSDETDRLVKVYVERLAIGEEEIRTLMSEERWLDAEEAMRIGLITRIIPPMTARSTKKLPPTMNAMQRAVAGLAKMVGLPITEPIKAMTLNTLSGEPLEIDIEEGAEPQVGDTARPDGEHVLEDGRTIVVTDGKITEIREAQEQEPEQEPEPANEMEEEPQPQEDVEAIKAENEALKAENDQLKAEVESLKAEIETLKEGQKTEEETETLEIVNNAGGIAWLKAIKSSYTPAARQTTSPAACKSKLLQEMEKAGLKTNQN